MTKYTIINPYKSVNWDTAENYKANLHTHTCASDGQPTITEMVRAYYDAGYDILALTDHGVINRGWNTERKTYPLFNGFRKAHPMSEADYKTITKGLDRGGRGMTDLTGGIECNFAVFSKVHVNGYHTEYGSGVWGKENDYKTAALEIDRAGGVSVLNHVGDWVDSEHHPERSHSPFYIGYFADILLSAKSCLGLEIINNTDRVTRSDRVLWDELLDIVIPRGRNIFGFADDDSEKLCETGRSFELFPLSANTEENVFEAMKAGAFFAASKFDKSLYGKETEGSGEVPTVSRITIDGKKAEITITPTPSRDCKRIEWISGGKILSVGNTFRINEHEGKLGSYVRFKMYGDGGVTYSQPFILEYEGRPEKRLPVQPDARNIKEKLYRRGYFTRRRAISDFIHEKLYQARGK